MQIGRTPHVLRLSGRTWSRPETLAAGAAGMVRCFYAFMTLTQERTLTMSEDKELKDYLGIPRRAIPWYPTIDEELCTNCGVCVKACSHGTYGRTPDGNKVIVANPYHCEVFCESCRFQCPKEAISFPDRKAFKLILKELRNQYPPAA
jgi:NAD-dependent dihydropyrimidine dehydrogenase PreA subunit